MTKMKDAFGDLFPHGMLGSEKLSAYLYPSIAPLPDYQPMATINQLRAEISNYVNAKGWSQNNELLRAYKTAGMPPANTSSSDVSSTSSRRSQSKPSSNLPEIVLEPIVLQGVALPMIPAKAPALVVGKSIPFTITNEPPKIIESKLGELKTIKLSTPPVRIPGEKKGILSHPPVVHEGDNVIVIPTNPSSNIIPDQPFSKPAITQQERIATYTSDQANVGVIIKDWSKVKNERTSDAYTNKELKEFAKAYGIQVDANTNKENLVRLLRDYGNKNGLIK